MLLEVVVPRVFPFLLVNGEWEYLSLLATFLRFLYAEEPARLTCLDSMLMLPVKSRYD